MKICFVVGEIFAFGRYGGFGSLTRTLGKELVKRGHEVSVVTLQRAGQPAVQELDGIKILGYPPSSIASSSHLYKECDADIYHSEEPSTGTYFAQKAMPCRIHIVTSQDPRTGNDWLMEGKYFSLKKKLMFPLIYLYEKNSFVKKSVQRADGVYCQAKYIAPKTKKLYALASEPSFLPNPVEVPEKAMVKADKPTVCFVARWDKRKRPEIFFELAKKFPDVKFIAAGKAHDQKDDDHLRSTYGNIPNLEMTGFIDQFASNKLQDILERSWVMINTAARECLPVSFLEAAAHKCAILSANDPDGFAGHFGAHVQNDDYMSGLKSLLDGDAWKDKGEKGCDYVKRTHELNLVIDQHISVYQKLLEKK